MNSLMVSILVFMGVLNSQAEGLHIMDVPWEYTTKVIRAQKVKGIEVQVTKIYVEDCNKGSIHFEPQLMVDSIEGQMQSYLFHAEIRGTYMGCPDAEGEAVELESDKVFIPANKKGRIEMKVLLRKGFELKVKEVNQ